MESKKSFIATESSLAFSELIANALDIPFDKEITRKHANKLLDHYFDDISLILPKETENCNFENFASRSFEAFADFSEGVPLINIDQQWHMFLMDANILICIRTFTVLNKKESDQNLTFFKENLMTFHDPYHHETLREKLRPLILKHTEILPVANLLTMCMFSFMLCHELAHHNLGHVLERTINKQQELDADTQGFEYLKHISEKFEELNFLKIPPNMLGAPTIAMTYLRALEIIGVIATKSNSHPSANQRHKNLYRQFNAVANDNARYLFDGLGLSSKELIAQMRE